MAEPLEGPRVDALITIAVVRRPHGLAGEVRVHPETDFPERFASLRRAYLVRGGAATGVEVERVRGHAAAPLVKFRGIDTAEAAAEWRGARLAVTRDAVHPLPAGHYYIFEIVGLQVEAADGEALGEVAAVLRGEAHDTYVVRRPDGRELLLPARHEVIAAVDVPGGRLVVHPGLPEIV